MLNFNERLFRLKNIINKTGSVTAINIRSITTLVITAALLMDMTGNDLMAQQNNDARGAVIRSMLLPGLGHYYAGEEHRMRGHLHLSTEITFIGTYFGLLQREKSLQRNYTTFAALRSGVNIEGKSRDFLIAIGEFQSIHHYNDFQLRSRNWHKLIEVTPENSWNWESPLDREQYRNLRARRDRIQNHLPAIIGLMLVNRAVASISSANRVNRSNRSRLALYLIPVSEVESGHLTALIATWTLQL